MNFNPICFSSSSSSYSNLTFTPPSPNPLPVNALIVVLSIEELDLLKGVGRGVVGDNGWVHGQEGVEGRGASLLRANHQELWELFTRLLLGPDLHVSLVCAWVLGEREEGDEWCGRGQKEGVYGWFVKERKDVTWVRERVC